MNLHRFDLNLLRALDALPQENGVARAARRVGLSQPAMSASLKRLRQYFDDPLLNIVGREMILSPRATALVEPVREALLSVEAIFEVQPEFDAAKLRQAFHMAIADFLTPRVMPQFLATLGLEAPHVHLHVERVTDSTMCRLLDGDIALLSTCCTKGKLAA
jgi:DNA-binding transcriptional LysR family regulator